MNDTLNTFTNDKLDKQNINTKKDYSDIFSYLIPEIGDVVNSRYKLEKEIGRGGFGVVFKGFDQVLKKTVALKFLSPKVTDNERKFLRVRREVNLSQKITDDRVVKIFSLEQYENDKGKLHFIIMEFLEGKTLDSIIKDKGKFFWDEFKPMFSEILKGIKVLHQNNIIHRDLKPSNIMVNNGKIKILDFGLSKEMDDQEKTSSIGEIVGSPQYMSPEQVTEPDIDFRSDIYQLGLILYRGLTGNLPFDNESNTMDMIFKRINEEPKSLKDAGIKAPKFLEFGLTKTLEKEPDKRFASIIEMENYFEKEHYPLFGRTIRTIKKRPVLIISIVILIFLSFFLYFKYSNILTDIDSVKYFDDTVKVYNKVGTKLFERTFEDRKIVYANKQNIIGINRDTYDSFKTQDAITVFTTEKKKDLFYSGFQSFTDPQNKKSFLYLLKENKLISYFENYLTVSTHKLSELYYDFANIYSIGSFKSINFGNKTSNDIFFQLSHYYYMYPSGIYILTKGRINLFFNPGPLYMISYNSDSENRKFLINGTNNILSHLNFVIELNENKLILSANNNLKTFEGSFAIPTLNKDTYNDFKGLFILIPRYSMLFENKWFDKEGFLTYRNSLEKDSIVTVNRNYKIIHKTGKGIKEYFDSKTTLNKVYALVNYYYKEKLLAKDYKKALTFIDDALEIPIQNIWLKSSLLYFKGDLLIRLGKFMDGAFILKKSLNFYLKNTDAFQRLTEISFLTGNTEEAINIVSNAENDMSAFWGLNRIGKNLFETYCYLQDGRFLKASDKIEYSKKKYQKGLTQLDPIIRSISNIFSGHYKEALIKTNNIRGKTPMPFTLIEYRLVYSRATILYSIFKSENDTSISENYKKIKKLARFYIKDIAVNSISSNRLAKISRAYFLVIDGQKREAERMAKEGFDEVLKMSRGDFFTKLWLFYDAFIYGKTMEILDNKTEAIRGYKACIKANQYTDLANKSKEKVESLKIE